MKNNVITVNYDNVKYRLVLGQDYFTAYFKDQKPLRFSLKENENVLGLASVIAIKGGAILTNFEVMSSITPRNSFVWSGKDTIDRYNSVTQQVSSTKLSTKHGKELFRALLRKQIAKAA